MAGSDSDESDDAKLPAAIRTDPAATSYVYRDFASLPEDPSGDNAPAIKRGNSESSIRVQKFPVKLYAILSQKEFGDIVTWMPHGRAWKVLKPNLFESLVMPLFFEYSNYHSFNRLVNAWSFRRISSGPDRGSYYHELFLRGKPHLQRYMRRLPKTHKKLSMKKEDEPDFYKMHETSPLPELEDDQASSTSVAARRQVMTAQAGEPINVASAAASMPGTGLGMNPALARGARVPPVGMASYPGSLSASLLGRPTQSLGGMESAASAHLSALEQRPSALLPASEPSMARLSALDQFAASLQSPPSVASLQSPSSAAALSSPAGRPAAAAMPPRRPSTAVEGTLSPSLARERSRSSMGLGERFPAMPPPFEPSQIPFNPPPPNAATAAAAVAQAQALQLQRLRQLQHLQLLQRQLGQQQQAAGGDISSGGATANRLLTEEELLRLQALGRGQQQAGVGGGSSGTANRPLMEEELLRLQALGRGGVSSSSGTANRPLVEEELLRLQALGREGGSSSGTANRPLTEEELLRLQALGRGGSSSSSGVADRPLTEEELLRLQSFGRGGGFGRGRGGGAGGGDRPPFM